MDKSLFSHIRLNKQLSVLLIIFFLLFTSIFMTFMFALFLGVGSNYQTDLFFYLILSVIISTLYILWSIKQGDKFIFKVTGAKPVLKKDYPYLYHTVEGLTIAAGLKNTPSCYVIDDTALNAYATGPSPDKSSIVVTTGLLDKLNRQQLEGVLAHEMSHILNYDIRFMMITTVLVGLITILSQIMLRSMFYSSGRRSNNNGGESGAIIFLVIGLVLAIISPIIAQIIRFAISRKREFLADASGAQLTRYPEGLASALEKIKNDPDPLIEKANRGTAHLFISTPFRKKSWANKLFSTHPSIDERIKRLRSM